MTCAAGVNYIERTLSLPMGAYRLNFKDADNCKVTVNGKDSYTVNVRGEIVSGFRVEAEKGNVVIRVSRVKADVWGFASMDLKLAFDFEPSRNELKETKVSALTELNKNIINADDLKNAATALANRANKINEGLSAIRNANATDAQLFTIYGDWQLFKTPSKLKADADALNNDIKAHNKLVEAANDAYDNQQANIANRDHFRESQGALTVKVDGVKDATTGEPKGGLIQSIKAKLDAEKNATTKAQLQKYYDEALALSAEIKAFGATIEDTYANLDVNADDTRKKLQATLAQLSNKYIKLYAADGGVSDDIDAYNAFAKWTNGVNQNYQNYLDLENLYLQYQTAFAQFKGNKGFEDIFADAISMKYGRELTETYEAIRELVVVDRAKKTINLPDIFGAADVYKDGVLVKKGLATLAKEAFELGLDMEEVDGLYKAGSLARVHQDAEAFVDGQNKAKTAADAVVAKLRALYKASAGKSVPANFQNDFNSKLSAANSAITAIENSINAAYGNIEAGKALSEATYSGSLENVVKVDGVITSCTTQKQIAVDNYLTSINDVVKAATDFAEFEAEVKRVDIDGMLANIVKSDFDNLRTKIAALTPSNYNERENNKDELSRVATINKKIADLKPLVLGDNGLVKAFDAANCANEIESLEKFIADTQIVDGAMDFINGKEVAFNKKTYTDKEFVKVPVNGKDTKVSFADRAKTFADQVTAAVKDNEGSVSATLAAIVKIGQSDPVKGLQKAISDLRKEFNAAAAYANVRAAQNAYNTVKTALEEIKTKEYPTFGKGDPGSLNVENIMKPATTVLTQIRSDRDAAVNANKEADCAKLYKTVNDFLGEEIKNLNTAYKDAINNVNAYKDLVKAYEAVNQEAIANVRDYNDKNSFKKDLTDSAWDFYDKKIGSATERKSGFEKRSKDILDAINAAVAKPAVKDNAYTKKADILGDIQKLGDDMDDLVTFIQKNEAAHNELLGEAELVRNILDQIDAKVKDGYNPWDTETKEVSDLLLKCNQAITTSYNKGESDAAKVEQIASLAEVKLKAEQILAKFNSDYTNEIVKQNEALFQQNWSGDNGIYGKLYKSYSDAVDAATKYELLKNRGYKAYVNADVHADGVTGYGTLTDLTQYINKLNDVNKRADQWKLSLTKDDKNPVLFNTANTDYQALVREANGYKTKIEEIANAMKGRIVESAENYYNGTPDEQGQLARAQEAKKYNSEVLKAGKVANAEYKYSILENGKAKDVTKKVETLKNNTKPDEDNIKAATNAYSKVGNKNLGIEMDGIATSLDKVQKLLAAQVNEIGADDWKATCEALDYFVTEWTAEMATFTSDTNRNDKKNGNTVKKGNLTFFNEAVKAYNDYKTEVANKVNKDGDKYITVTSEEGASVPTATNNLDAWKTTLEQKLNAIDNVYKTARTSHMDNTEAAAQFRAYTDGLTAADGVETLYNELKAFTNSIAADNAECNAAAELLATIKKDINTYKGNYKVNYPNANPAKTAKEHIDADIKSFKENLADWYYSVGSAEIAALTSQFTIVNSALNEAYVAGIENFEDYQKEVVELSAIIAGTKDGITSDIRKAQALDSDAAIISGIKALKEDMRAMEAKLSSLEVTLKKNNPMPGVLGTLNEKYDDVKAVVNEADAIVNSFDDVVKGQFKSYIDAKYAEALDAIKSGYSTVGDIAIMQKDNYILAMDEILAKVSETLNGTKGLKATKAKVEESQAVFDALSGQITKLTQRRNDLADLMGSYEYFKYIVKYTDEELAEKFSQSELENLTELQKYNVKKVTDFYDAQFAHADKLLADALADITAKNTNADVDKRLKEGANLDAWLKDSKDKEDNTVNGLETTLNNKIELSLTAHEFEGAKNVWTIEGKNVENAIKNPFILDDVKADLIAQAKKVGAERTAIGDNIPKADTNKGETHAGVNKAYAAKMDKVIKELRAIVADAAENSFRPGDLNRDGKADIFDVSEFASILANGVTYEELAAENLMKAKAVDLNYDKNLRVGDLVILTRLAVDKIYEDNFIANASAGAAKGANLVTTSLVSREGGISTYAVNIQNSSDFVAGELDLVLADGMTVVDIKAGERAADHTLYTATDNKRVVLANMNNASINGSNGAVLYVEVFGDGKLDVDNVIFADKQGVDYRIAKPEGTSGIEDAVIDNNGGLKRIYNAAGQMLRGLQRGVNIIRNADGSVSKEYHK